MLFSIVPSQGNIITVFCFFCVFKPKFMVVNYLLNPYTIYILKLQFERLLWLNVKIIQLVSVVSVEVYIMFNHKSFQVLISCE